MNEKYVTKLLISPIFLTFAACSPDEESNISGGAGSPEELAESYIEAVNAEHREKHQALNHPSSFSDLSTAQEAFISDAKERDLAKTVPDDRTIEIQELEDGELPFGDRVSWPIKPTHSIEIEFGKDEFSATTMVRFIVEDQDRWWIVDPVLKDEFLVSEETDS